MDGICRCADVKKSTAEKERDEVQKDLWARSVRIVPNN